eukprot:jgi/Psemu1/7244/gm1.7244_g
MAPTTAPTGGSSGRKASIANYTKPELENLKQHPQQGDWMLAHHRASLTPVNLAEREIWRMQLQGWCLDSYCNINTFCSSTESKPRTRKGRHNNNEAVPQDGSPKTGGNN